MNIISNLANSSKQNNIVNYLINFLVSPNTENTKRSTYLFRIKLLLSLFNFKIVRSKSTPFTLIFGRLLTRWTIQFFWKSLPLMEFGETCFAGSPHIFLTGLKGWLSMGMSLILLRLGLGFHRDQYWDPFFSLYTSTISENVFSMLSF